MGWLTSFSKEVLGSAHERKRAGCIKCQTKTWINTNTKNPSARLRKEMPKFLKLGLWRPGPMLEALKTHR